jgi:hypothetical protein
METDTSGRVLPIRGGNMMSPAVCLICRRSGSDVDETFADPSELFADPQITEDFFGSVYFCRGCALGLAAIFGAKSNEEVMQLEADLLMYKAISEEQAVTIKEAHDALTALRRVDERAASLLIDASSVVSPTVNDSEQSTQQGLSESTEQRADEGTVITESSNGEGPDDANESERDDVNEFLRNL